MEACRISCRILDIFSKPRSYFFGLFFHVYLENMMAWAMQGYPVFVYILQEQKTGFLLEYIKKLGCFISIFPFAFTG